MIDLVALREDRKRIEKLLKIKDSTFDIGKLVELDEEVRGLRSSVENLRKEKNALAKKVAFESLTEEMRQKSIKIGKELKTKEKALENLEKEFKKLWLSCPNIIVQDVPEGGSENNKVVKVFSKPPAFDFKPKNHLELNESLGWFDFDGAAKIAGSHFVFYRKDAVKLIYALAQLMLRNNVKHGFEVVLPPYLANGDSLTYSGNLPKFVDDVYKVADKDLYLVPTAEVSLTSLHSNSVLSSKELPLRYSAWTGCFRSEAGGYGSQERGLIRIHQFEKVELYSICHPGESGDELDMMISCAEDILQQLNLHYRISLLAAQDCSFASAKTYDIEVWLPGQEKYYEISSASNCTDFQARRAGIRYRETTSSKPQLVHTLNVSSLALPRLMVALIETYQQKDGSIKLPGVLEEICANLW